MRTATCCAAMLVLLTLGACSSAPGSENQSQTVNQTATQTASQTASQAQLDEQYLVLSRRLMPSRSDSELMSLRSTVCDGMRQKPTLENMNAAASAFAKEAQVDVPSASLVVGAAISTGCSELLAVLQTATQTATQTASQADMDEYFLALTRRLMPSRSDSQLLAVRKALCENIREKPTPENMIDVATAFSKTEQLDVTTAGTVVGAAITTGCPEFQDVVAKLK